MNVLILTLGTRGDLELFLLLARTLRDRGHNVHLVTSQFHAHRVQAAGIPCTPIGTQDHASLDALLASLAPLPDLRLRTRAYVEKFLRPELTLATAALQSLAASSDYFISNLKITFAKNGSILPTAFVTYDPPAALEELDRYSAQLPRERILELAAFPKSLIDPASAWPARFHFTGFWLDPTPPPPLTDSVTTFLAADPPPIILTPGSMRMFDPARLTAAFAAALAQTHQRGILLGLPIPQGAENPQLLRATDIPYSALFPHAGCIIHHGGVGTVAHALRAGKPSILLPQILAQQHMAELLQRHNLCPAPLDPAALSADNLGNAIAAALRLEAPRQWPNLITHDSGILAAAAAIERHWSTISPP